MSVIVDTIIGDEVQLTISPSHAIKERIDLICVKDGDVCIVEGMPAYSAVPPTPPVGTRALALIRILPCDYRISEVNIKEIQ